MVYVVYEYSIMKTMIQEFGMKKWIFGLCFLVSVCFALNVYATPVSVDFGDTSTHWEGWGGGVCTWNSGVSDDSRDTIGTPDLTGGNIVFDEGKLKSVSIDYSNSADYGEITPGDLFIDMGADNYWDYVIDTSTATIYSFGPTDFDLSDGSGYILSGDIDNYNDGYNDPNTTVTWNPPYNATWDIRDDHPVQYNTNSNLGSSTGEAAFISPSAFVYTVGSHTFSYENLDLALWGGNIAIGWTIDCANDVLYESVPAPVPEPATMLLFGIGLLGFGTAMRKKKA